MPALTVYLSRLIGLVGLIAGVAMLVDKQPLVAAVGGLSSEPGLLWVVGILSLIGGVAIVLVHNVWRHGSAAFLVTLAGWMLLLRGVLVVVLPPDLLTQMIATLHFAEFYYLYAAIPLVLGAYLCLRGFMAAAPPGAAAPPQPAPPPAPKSRLGRRRR